MEINWEMLAAGDARFVAVLMENGEHDRALVRARLLVSALEIVTTK
jgi:hypothetical protein